MLYEGGVSPPEEEVDLGWPIALRKGTRSCVKHKFPQHKALLLKTQDISIPKTPHEALQSFYWKEAMNEEMSDLPQNDTWEIVDLPKGKIPVSCRWVSNLKCKPNGSLDRHKAILVARGYTQKNGIYHQETFALVAKLNTIQLLISLVVNFDWPLRQYDIKNGFLHRDLKEDIYEYSPRIWGSYNKGKSV